MAAFFDTATPSDLLTEFNRRIKQVEPTGSITTWEITDDGKFYTHKSAEWRAKA
jgi:hypothetical protein